MSPLTSSDPFWNAFDKIDAAGLVRECPSCHERPDDVKFAIHSQRIAGCDISARCATCKHEESCMMDAAESLLLRWHAPKHPPQPAEPK